jgi:hypothetical protein
MQKITPEYLNSQIEKEHYWHVPGTMLTVCVLVGKNTVEALGESSCADPALFSEEVGKQRARAKAFDKLWEYYGVILKAEKATAA